MRPLSHGRKPPLQTIIIHAKAWREKAAGVCVVVAGRRVSTVTTLSCVGGRLTGTVMRHRFRSHKAWSE